MFFFGAEKGSGGAQGAPQERGSCGSWVPVVESFLRGPASRFPGGAVVCVPSQGLEQSVRGEYGEAMQKSAPGSGASLT